MNKPKIPTITVVNKHHGAAGEYIGRGSPLGNPYKVKPYGPYERGKTIQLYQAYLDEEIQFNNRIIINELNRLAEIAIKTGELKLQCFCSPSPCHGEIIRDLLIAGITQHLNQQEKETA